MSEIRSDIWKILSQTELSTLAVVRLHKKGGGYIPLSTGPVNIEGDEYIPILASIPFRNSKMDWYTRKFTVSNMTLEILDSPFEGDTRFSELLDSKIFDGQDAEVKLWKPGIKLWADCLPRFVGGKIRRTPTRNNRVSIDIEDGTALNMVKDMPLLSQADATTGYDLPEESLGVIKPRVLGPHLFPINLNVTHTSTDFTDWVGSRVNHVSRMRHLGGRRYMVSDRQVGGSAVEATMKALGTSVWGVDRNVNRLMELKPSNWALIQNDANGCIIERTGNQFLDYRLPYDQTLNEWIDADKCIDRDIFSSATLQYEGALAPQKDALRLLFPANDLELTLLNSTVDVFMAGEGDWIQGGGSEIHLQIFDGGGIDFLGEFAGSGQGTGEDEYSDSAFFAATISSAVSEDLEALRITAVSEEGLPGGFYDFTVREVYLRVEYTNIDDLDLYWGGLGEIYTSDFGLAGRTANADTAETGNPVDNFIGALEWYLRTVTLLSSGDLNLDSLDTASNLVAGLEPSFHITEQPETTLDLFFKLVQSFKSFASWDVLNQLSVLVLENDYLTPDVVIDGNLIRDMGDGRSDERRLYGSVQVQYAGSEIGGKGLTPEDTDALALAENNLTAEQSYLLFDGFAYRTLATAVTMGEHFREAFKLGRNILDVKLPEPFTHLGVGDVVGVTDLPKPMRGHDMEDSYVLGGQTFRPNFLMLSVNADNNIHIEGTQIAVLVP